MNRSPQTGIEIGKQTMLLPIDTVSLPFRRRLGLYMTRPEVRLEPVLGPDGRDPNTPDNMCAHFYGTVLHEEGPFEGNTACGIMPNTWGVTRTEPKKKAKLMGYHK